MDKTIIEDYFLSNKDIDISDKRLVLVIYDITDNKRRNKFVKLMESFGIRVQKSAFEMIITNAQYESLLRKIPAYIEDEDNIRVYKLRVTGEVVTWGSGMPEPAEVIII
ncbi:MAG: CRISPR-associated endonuclease Cas2 [Firmicutes bacterium]|nr:CRISPR-associated endonuclease Cas2 [Bacillota bacterium]